MAYIAGWEGGPLLLDLFRLWGLSFQLLLFTLKFFCCEQNFHVGVVVNGFLIAVDSIAGCVLLLLHVLHFL